MNRFDNFTGGTTSHSTRLPNDCNQVVGYKPLMWLMALLLAAVVAGCGGHSETPAMSSTKALTAFSFNTFTAYPGLITAPSGLTPGRVAVILPNGTNVKALVATFATTGLNVTVAGTTQASGITPNDFTNPVSYKVTAGDGTWATYTVTVAIAPANAKALTAFSLALTTGTATGTINEAAKTIAVTLPFNTSLTGLVATFTTTGASVTVAGALQSSGTTPNTFPAFPGSLAYTVHAADTTMAVYNVTVTVSLNPAKAITSFSFPSLVGASGVITAASGVTPATIAVTLPSGTTDLSALVATFTTTGASVTVAGSLQNPQQSGTTANDFSAASGVNPNPVAYTVHAADTTTALYNVTVTVATASTGICTGTVSACVDLGNAGNFAILTKAGITDVPASPITGNIGTSGITGASITVPCTDVLTGQVFTDDANYPGFTCTSTDKTMAGLAVGDMGAAYTAAAGKAAVPGSCPGVGAMSDVNDVGALAPGVYTCAVDVTIPGDLTLNGNSTDVWVFQITGKLTQSSATTVHLTGGALAQNVFWQVSDVVQVGTTAHMEGVILAQTAIHMLTGSSINGRLLAQTAVTLDTATVTEP